MRDLRDRAQLFGRRHVVGTTLRDAERLLMDQSGDADFEELVEVRIRDAQERQPFEQRHVVVFRQFEHAPVEFELRQLAVDVQLGAQQVRVWVLGAFIARRIERVLRPARKLIMAASMTMR